MEMRRQEGLGMSRCFQIQRYVIRVGVPIRIQIAVKRDGTRPPATSDTTWVIDDLSRVPRIVEVIREADAVVSAYAPPAGATDALIEVCQGLAEAVSQTGVPRLVVVGDAGVLQIAPGVTLLQSGKLPPDWVPIATSHLRALAALKQTSIDVALICLKDKRWSY